MAKLEYHQLPEDKQWLGWRNVACTVGGRDTDISQIAISLEIAIKEHYVINGVPPEVVKKVKMLKGSLETAEERIQELIMLVAIGEDE